MRLIDADEAKVIIKECVDLGADVEEYGAEQAVINLLDAQDEANAIVIPDNATNGDVIKAIFPICCSNMGNLDNGIVVDFVGDLHTFNKDWWNAPYKKGE